MSSVALKPPGKPWPSWKSGIISIILDNHIPLADITYLGGQELGQDVGQDTTLRDDDRSEELVELFIVADGELQVTGHDTRLFVVTGSVTGELENLGGEVLEDGSEVDGGTGTDTLGVVAALEETVDTTDGDYWSVCDRCMKRGKADSGGK